LLAKYWPKIFAGGYYSGYPNIVGLLSVVTADYCPNNEPGLFSLAFAPDEGVAPNRPL
jgi:hypothetical protein